MTHLDSMRVLIAVVDLGSLSAAGRKLGMPLATVSRKVAQLEAHLKARLLIRSTRQLKLTDAGRTYVAACRRILDDVHEAERTVAGEYGAPRGEVVVTAPIVFGRLHVLPALCEFMHAYPDVNVRLLLGDRLVNLLEDQVHLAVRIGALPDSGLMGTSLGNIRRVVCASPAYLKQRGIPVHPRELTDHACVSFDLFAAANAWRFSQAGREISVPIHPRLVVNTAEAAIDAAIKGVGVTSVLSYQVASAVRAHELELLLSSFEQGPIPVAFVYADQGRLPLKLRALLDFAAPRLRARLKNMDSEFVTASRAIPARRASKRRAQLA